MFYYRFIMCFILLIACFKGQAVNIIHFTEAKSNYIGKSISYHEDPTSKLTIGQLLKSNVSFEESNSEVLNFGITNSTYWLKFTVSNHSDCRNLVLNLENPLLNAATLYIVKDSSVVDSISIESYKTQNNRVFDHQFLTFKFFIEYGDNVTYYFKTNSNMQLLIPLSIYQKDDLANNLLKFDLRTGIFIGFMLAMLLYNLFLFLSLKDLQYFYYVNYILWVTIAQIAVLGLFHRFLHENYAIVNYIVPFSGAMSGIASVLFVRSFLSIKDYTRRFGVYLNIIIIADAVAILLLFVDVSLGYKLVNFVAGIGSLFVLYIAFYVRRKGSKVANLFLIAWGIFLSTVIVFVLKDIGVIRYSQLTTYIVQLGVSIEALLLSFALANKMNIYRREKEESQKREFNALRENDRLIREQNIILEEKIEERTHELQLSNHSLQDAIHDLKEAQSQLVESEKMASLGQLTAGVAHEINNPINFVTSNVKPLKRDLEMVWDAFSYVENVALEENSLASDRKTRIDSYKRELDIDYLKSEIDFLLRGMHDGASRTAEIVKSLRIFSRVDEDAVMKADINLGIESTLVILGSLLSENIQLDKKLGNLPQIECYPGKLNQVFLNILTNGIYAVEKKFNNKPGGIIKIESTLIAEEGFVQILIEDNGIGIPSAVINKIFEPFFTTKDVGEGTGLGMSIAYNTVLKHNGELIVSSVEGEKTTFIIKLPVNQIV